MKISVVITVLNEAETILVLLFGLLVQTKQPDEVIIVDGGSTDQTVQLIKAFQKKYKKFPLKVFIKKGNRSVGRNFGIKKSIYNWIAITDAGCMPHKDWLEKLAKKATEIKTDVVAGYYDGVPETAFQTAVVPYMLVMPDKVNPEHFLPATRSMLVKKEAWRDLNGFDETLEVSEDYAFAHKLIEKNYQLEFTAQAKVSWWPIKSLGKFYKTVKAMAYFDARAGLIRPKTYLVFGRYMIFLSLTLVFCSPHWFLGLGFIIISTLFYSIWAMWKNAQYLDRGWLYLPILQITADLGVMSGTMSHGILKP